MAQRKEQIKIPEEELKEMEISNLSDAYLSDANLSDNSVSPCTPLVPFKLPPWCWSSEGASLSR